MRSTDRSDEPSGSRQEQDGRPEPASSSTGAAERDSAPPGRRRAAGPPDDQPLLPERATEDTDEAWGEPDADSEHRDDEWYRRERPPHHDT